MTVSIEKTPLEPDQNPANRSLATSAYAWVREAFTLEHHLRGIRLSILLWGPHVLFGILSQYGSQPAWMASRVIWLLILVAWDVLFCCCLFKANWCLALMPFWLFPVQFIVYSLAIGGCNPRSPEGILMWRWMGKNN